MTPWQRFHHRSVVRCRIEQLIRVAVPSVIRPFLPQPGAIQVRRCNAIERKSGDAEGQFEGKESDERFRSSPLPWDGVEARRYPHVGGGGPRGLLISLSGVDQRTAMMPCDIVKVVTAAVDEQSGGEGQKSLEHLFGRPAGQEFPWTGAFLLARAPIADSNCRITAELHMFPWPPRGRRRGVLPGRRMDGGR